MRSYCGSLKNTLMANVFSAITNQKIYLRGGFYLNSRLGCEVAPEFEHFVVRQVEEGEGGLPQELVPLQSTALVVHADSNLTLLQVRFR